MKSRRTLERSRRAAALSAVLLGCHASEDDTPAYQTLPVIAGCEQQFFEACDVLDGACQERVFATMMCLRQMPDAVLPPIRVLSSAEQLAEFQADYSSADVASSDAEERALGLLQLAQPGELSPDKMAQVLVDTTSAYYDYQTGVITLTPNEEGEPRDEEQEMLTLAHEFVHALQDQDASLSQLFGGLQGFDDYLGRSSLVEGEATMLQGFVAAALWGFGDNPDFREHFTSWLGRAQDELASQSPLLVAPRYIPYSYGSRYVFNLYEQHGVAGVRARFSDPPRSVLPMLLSVDRLDEPALDSMADVHAPEPLDGSELALVDTLGPWVFQTFLERLLVDPLPAALVQAWRGDRLVVYTTADAAPAVSALWILRFADAGSAELLEQYLRDRQQRFALRSNSFWSRRDRDLTIGVSERLPTLPDWSASLELAQQSWGSASPAAAPPPRRGALALARRWLR